jgi:hypothetical protein
VVTIYDILLASILGVRGRVASVAYPFSYIAREGKGRWHWKRWRPWEERAAALGRAALGGGDEKVATVGITVLDSYGWE